MNKKQGMVIWITGLSGSGKTTLAYALEEKLKAEQIKTCVLDGDIVRNGLCKDLGYSSEDRKENIRRIAEVCKLMISNGWVVIAAFISPAIKIRQMAREIIYPGTFFEVYLSTPLNVCEQRDIKGLYKKARIGEIPDFTGISAPYEVPLKPDIDIDTSNKSVSECVEEVYVKVIQRKEF